MEFQDGNVEFNIVILINKFKLIIHLINLWIEIEIEHIEIEFKIYSTNQYCFMFNNYIINILFFG